MTDDVYHIYDTLEIQPLPDPPYGWTRDGDGNYHAPGRDDRPDVDVVYGTRGWTVLVDGVPAAISGGVRAWSLRDVEYALAFGVRARAPQR